MKKERSQERGGKGEDARKRSRGKSMKVEEAEKEHDEEVKWEEQKEVKEK